MKLKSKNVEIENMLKVNRRNNANSAGCNDGVTL